MKLSDNPHRVGTPEHNEWVRTVFIPGQAHRMATDGAEVGAEAQGRKLIHGGPLDPDTGNPVDPPWGGAAGIYRRAERDLIDKLFNDVLIDEDNLVGLNHWGAFRHRDDGDDGRRNDLNIFMEEWIGLTNRATVLSVLSVFVNSVLFQTSVIDVGQAAAAAARVIQVFDDVYTRPPNTGPSRAQRRAKPDRNPKKKKRQCPRHGGDLDRCTYCQRNRR